MREPTLKEKVQLYERLLHLISDTAQYNPKRFAEVLERVQAWSVSHRFGEETEKEYEQRMRAEFFRLAEFIRNL